MSSELNDDDWVDVKASASTILPLHPAHTRHNVESLASESLQLQQCMERTARRNLADYKDSPIFHVDIEPHLDETFRSKLPPSHLQYYACTTCYHFKSRFGKLALVTDNGVLVPLFWPSTEADVPPSFRPAITAIYGLFEDRKVTKEFKVMEKTKVIGHRERGGFTHMFFEFPTPRVCNKLELKGFTSIPASEAAAMLSKVLSEYKIGTVRRTKQILDQNKLGHADNHKAAIIWLFELQEADALSKVNKDEVATHNLLYRLAVSTFVGCLKQLRSGVLATLLDDVKANRPFKSIQIQWNKLSAPARYMRPTAAPPAGNITAAERLFKELGFTKDDMRRRYLVHTDLPDDVHVWRKSVPSKPADSIFGDIVPKANPSANPASKDLPWTRITFTNFVNKYLPTAKRIEYKLGTRDAVAFFITGLQGTKPLMQWHRDDTNLASWYFHIHPRPVQTHNLLPDSWNEVSAIIPFPHLWDAVPLSTTFPLDGADEEVAEDSDKMDMDVEGSKSSRFKYYHKKNGFRYLLCLKAIKDAGMSQALFPQLLKSEFHPVRSTVERYSAAGMVEEHVGEMVGGICFDRSAMPTSKIEHHLRVTRFDGTVDFWQIALFE